MEDNTEDKELMVVAPLSVVICSPATCPIGENCPIGPMPNLKCEIKSKYTLDVQQRVIDMFPMLNTDPVIRMKVDFLLVPLYEQLMKLRMAEYAHFRVIAGGKINPIMAELRKTSAAIEKLVDGITEKQGNNIDDMKSANKGVAYYDMLFTDGITSVDERVGFDRGIDE